MIQIQPHFMDTPTKVEFNPKNRVSTYFEIPEKVDSLFVRAKNLLATPVFIDGVDMSHWNSERDFAKIKASGIDFVILKATEGTSFVDPQWNNDWRAALDEGLIVMPFHFHRSNLGGAPQANFHIDTIMDYLLVVGGTPILWDDVETSDGATLSQRQNRLHAYVQTIVSNGFQAGYYSSPYLWNTLIGDVDWADEYLQWVAHWTSASQPDLPIGWSREKTKFWQYGIYPTYSWAKPVEGAGTVDVDRFYGTLEDLKELLGLILPPIDCCMELALAIESLEKDVAFLKGEIGTLNQRVEVTEFEVAVLNSQMEEVDDIVTKISSIFCDPIND